MSSEKASALVLRLVDFSETSSVVTLFTREFGKVQALAKGGRRPKGPFESALDLLALCRIVFLRKSSDALDLLTEAKLERRFRPPAGSLAALYAGYYLAELLGALTDNYDPHPELFDEADEALSALRRRRPGTESVSIRVDGVAIAGAFALAGHLRRVRRGGAAGRSGAVFSGGGGRVVWDVPNRKDAGRFAERWRAGGDARAGRSAAGPLASGRFGAAGGRRIARIVEPLFDAFAWPRVGNAPLPDGAGSDGAAGPQQGDYRT